MLYYPKRRKISKKSLVKRRYGEKDEHCVFIDKITWFSYDSHCLSFPFPCLCYFFKRWFNSFLPSQLIVISAEKCWAHSHINQLRAPKRSSSRWTGRMSIIIHWHKWLPWRPGLPNTNVFMLMNKKILLCQALEIQKK